MRQAVVEELAVGEPGQGILEREGLQLAGLLREVRHRLADLVLGAPGRGDVAEAPDAAHHLVADLLRARIPLESASVAELQHVVALGRRIGVEGGHLGQELLGVRQLAQHGAHHGLVVAGVHELAVDAPHGEELVVDGGDPAPGTDHQDAVRGGLQRGGEQGHRFAEPGVLLGARGSAHAAVTGQI